MRQGVGFLLRMIVALSLLVGTAGCALAQDVDRFAITEMDDADTLTATQRLFPQIGPGLRAVKRDAAGHYYVLASPAPGLTVFDAAGKTLLQLSSAVQTGIPARVKPPILFGEDCDVDAAGRIYVADRGAGAVKIFSPTGELLRTIPVAMPISLASMSGGEIAVSTLRGPHLVTVFDLNGREVREFGDPADIAEREDLNRFLNIGRLARDARDHLYYAFDYLPEPTVREFDRQGYSKTEIQVTTLDVLPKAQAIRREIQRQEKRGDSPSFKRVLTAVGVDPVTGEVWIALENTLFHFDREGNRRSAYRLYTPEGARLEATSILIEAERLLIGSDPLGVYEFARPDKPR
jgi:DNA-binding beta-propeller fold protein YncE